MIMMIMIMIIMIDDRDDIEWGKRSVHHVSQDSQPVSGKFKRENMSKSCFRETIKVSTCSNSPEKGKSKFLLNVVCTKFLCCDAMVKSIDRTLCVLVFFDKASFGDIDGDGVSKL